MIKTRSKLASNLASKLFLGVALATSAAVATYLPMNSRYSNLQSQHQTLETQCEKIEEDYSKLKDEQTELQKSSSRLYRDNVRLTELCKALTEEKDTLNGMAKATQILDDILSQEISTMNLEKKDYTFNDFSQLIGNKMPEKEKKDYWESLNDSKRKMICIANSRPVFIIRSTKSPQRNQYAEEIRNMTQSEWDSYRAKYPFMSQTKEQKSAQDMATIYIDKIITESKPGLPFF